MLHIRVEKYEDDDDGEIVAVTATVIDEATKFRPSTCLLP